MFDIQYCKEADVAKRLASMGRNTRRALLQSISALVLFSLTSTAHADDASSVDSQQSPPQGQNESGTKQPDMTKPGNKLTASGVPPPEVETLTVSGSRHPSGGGLMVQQTAPQEVSTVTASYIQKQVLSVAPSALIASLPGVQVGNEGPFTTENETIHIRGLDATEIGLVFDDIPISDALSYTPWTQAAVDNENISSINVQQGSVDLMAPVYNADGAMIDIRERRPAQRAAGLVDVTGGTDSLHREFIRLDSGELGRSGLKSFISFSNSSANLWRGAGTAQRYHVDANVEKTWQNNSDTDLTFGYTHSHENIYRLPTLSQWQNNGTSFNYDRVYTPGDTNYYAINERFTNFVYGGLKNNIRLTDHLTLRVDPYVIDQEGPNNYGLNVPIAGGYLGTQRYEVLDGSAGKTGTLTTESVHPYRQISSGLTAALDWTRGYNTLSLFYFYNYVTHQEIQYNYPLTPTGGWTESGKFVAVGGRTVTQYDIDSRQQINALGLDNKLALMDGRLKLDAGLKVSMASRSVSDLLPGASPYKVSPNYVEPTPQFLISYDLNRQDQFYANATSSYRLPAGFTAYVPQYSITSPRPSVTPPKSLAPEFFIGEEIGFRHHGPVNVSVGFFHYNLTNHQISSSSYLPGTSTLVTAQIAAGGEEAWGFQGEIGTQPWHHLSAYLSGQYLHTEIGNNVFAGADYLPTKGRTEPGSPDWSGAIGLTYDDGVYFANFNLRYQGSQYSTLMNDQSIPAYITSDISFGRTLWSPVERVKPKLIFNLMNVGNADYLSSVSGFTLTSKTQRGVFGNTVNGSAPIYIVGSGFAGTVTLSTSF